MIGNYLISKGVDVNAKDNASFTALIYASIYNQTEIANMLINAGADVKYKDETLTRINAKPNANLEMLLDKIL